MRPLIVFSGQGLARADGLNLTRRVKALPAVAAVLEQVPWRERQNLDAVLEIFASLAPSELGALVQAIRAICLKERRATARKHAHRAVLATLAEVATRRPVVHLTTNLDGLTSTVAARDFDAAWPPYHGIATVEEVASAIAGVLARGRGLAHLPLHGEAPLLASPLPGRGQALRTIYGDATLLRGAAPWTPTVGEGIGRGMERIREHLPLARLGYDLLDSLLRGDPARLDDGSSPRALPPADLLAVGYGADDRGSRATYPFEEIASEIAAHDAPRGRWSALVFDAPECARSARWYFARGFAVTTYGEGGLAGAVSAEVSAAMVTAPPSLA